LHKMSDISLFCDSYDALGLVATLKPTEAGGTEHTKYGNFQDGTPPSTSTIGDPKGIAELSTTGTRISARHGRIVRDEQGNAVDIELADEEDTVRKVETMDDMYHTYLDERSAAIWTQLAPCTTTKRPNSVVHELEKLSEDRSHKRGASRFLSEGEERYLTRLVGRHREDVEAMARDRKLNPEQRTAGELTRLIKKAGGFENLLGERL